MPAFPANPVKLPDCQLNWESLANLFKSTENSSNNVEGPAALGANLVYTAVEITITAGTWLVFAQATLSSQAAIDGKAIGIYNQTAGAYIANTTSPALDATVVNGFQAFFTYAVVSVTADTKLRIIAFRNGASQISVGYTGGGISPTQRITAIKIR